MPSRSANPAMRRSVAPENGRVSFAIAATDDEDALTILQTLRKHGADAVKAVRIEEESGR